jgi:glycosyltransferase involved in cell wall biosynthesis
MVHIAIISAVYPPEPVVSAQMGRDLAEHLANSGARVTVLCPYPSRPLGMEYPNFRPSSAARVDAENGVEVVRLPSFTAPQSRLVARMRESWSFGRHVCRYLEGQMGDVDVVYANIWPLFAQAAVSRAAAGLRIPLLLRVSDIYPETLVNKLPRWLGCCVIPPLRAWDRRIAHSATKVLVVANGVREMYQRTRRLKNDRIGVVEDWQDEQRFRDAHPRAQAAQHYAVDGAAFTFLYLGNIGPTTDMQLVIHAFAQASVANGQLLIVGDGSAKQACVALTRELGLKSARFLSCPSPSDVPALQSLADVCLLPLKKGVALNGVPSKLAAYLFSAKPVLATLDAGSDTARCIQEAQCGWVGEPEHVEWLAAKMAEVAVLPSAVLEAMGQRGRVYGLKHFSKAEGVKRLAAVILSAKSLLTTRLAAR